MVIRRLFQRLGLIRKSTHRTFELDASLHPMLDQLAEEEQRSPQELASSIMATGLTEKAREAELYRRWNTLTVRQQQVTACICLGYTNRQIAARLGISPNTVHTHSGKVQQVFEVRSKNDLSNLLENWDFSGWEF